MVLLSPVSPAQAGSTECEDHAGIHIYRDIPNCIVKSPICMSYRFTSIDAAKKSYRYKCGQDWKYDSGFHKCAWSPNGWQCWGPS